MRYLLTVSILSICAIVFFGTCSGGVATDDEWGSSSAVTLSDQDGTAIENSTAEPENELMVTFAGAVNQVSASMVCSQGDTLNLETGDVQDLDVVLISDTQALIKHASGEFPQRTTCYLRVTGVENVAVDTTLSANKILQSTTQSSEGELKFGCGLTDRFDNPFVVDTTADPQAYGNGCWKAVVDREYAGGFDFLPEGSLMVDMLSTAGLPFLDIRVLPHIVKRVSTSGVVEMNLDISSLGGLFLADNNIAAFALVITNNYYFTSIADIAWIFILYRVAWDEATESITVRCSAGLNFDDAPVVDCGDGTAIPTLSFVKDGSVITPRYKVQGTDTWATFIPVDASGVVPDRNVLSYDLGADFVGEVDVGFFGLANSGGYIIVDNFEILGAAELVQ